MIELAPARDTVLAVDDSPEALGFLTEAMLLGNIAEPLLALGRWQEAEQLIQRGLDLDAPLSHTRQFQPSS